MDISSFVLLYFSWIATQLIVTSDMIFHRTSLKPFLIRIPYKGERAKEKYLSSNIVQNRPFYGTEQEPREYRTDMFRDLTQWY